MRGGLDGERLHQQVAGVDLFPGVMAKTDALAYVFVPLLLIPLVDEGQNALARIVKRKEM